MSLSLEPERDRVEVKCLSSDRYKVSRDFGLVVCRVVVVFASCLRAWSRRTVQRLQNDEMADGESN